MNLPWLYVKFSSPLIMTSLLTSLISGENLGHDLQVSETKPFGFFNLQSELSVCPRACTDEIHNTLS